MNDKKAELFLRYKKFADDVRDEVGDDWLAILELQRILNVFILNVNKDEPSLTQIKVAMYDELGELIHELKPIWAWWTDKNKRVDKEKLLEEFVDFLHFYMSYIIENNDVEMVYNEGFAFEFDGEDVEESIPEIIDIIVESMDGVMYEDIEYWFSKLLGKFGITVEDVWNEYVRKSFENYMRQVDGKYGKISLDRFERMINDLWVIDGEG